MAAVSEKTAVATSALLVVVSVARDVLGAQTIPSLFFVLGLWTTGGTLLSLTAESSGEALATSFVDSSDETVVTIRCVVGGDALGALSLAAQVDLFDETAGAQAGSGQDSTNTVDDGSLLEAAMGWREEVASMFVMLLGASSAWNEPLFGSGE